MKISRSPRSINAFTLIELLVVISIIAILASLAMVSMKSAMTAAKKASAKTDMTTINTAVRSFYTDYGMYPLDTTQTTDAQAVFGSPGGGTTNDKLIDVLRNATSGNNTSLVQKLNPREVKYFEGKYASDKTLPKGGISQAANSNGQFMDPWGVQYVVFLDGDYDGNISVKSCFTSGFGSTAGSSDGIVPQSSGVASIGLKYSTTTPPQAAAHAYDKSNDLVTWQ